MNPEAIPPLKTWQDHVATTDEQKWNTGKLLWLYVYGSRYHWPTNNWLNKSSVS